MEYQHTVDKNRCKGCGLCVATCPKNVLDISKKVNSRGYYPVFQVRPDVCISCTMCCIMCPDVAITIEKKDSIS